MKILIYSDKAENYEELAAGAKSLGEVIAYAVCTADEAGKIPAARVFYTIDSPERMCEDYFDTLKSVVESEKPDAVLISATRRGKYMAARLAAVLGTSVLTDLNDISAEGAQIKGTQMYYGGAAVRALKSKEAISVVTTGSCSFDPIRGTAGKVVEAAFTGKDSRITRREIRPKTGDTVNLAVAKKVVGVGRGFAEKADLALAEALASATGAELGCSRPIAEGEGWMDTSRYIGVSGVMLKPDLYIAVGISGQIQHMIGINSAKVIIAINKDKNAPIFKQCDYGIVGDLKQVLPVLTGLIKS